jgi:polysaccharide pyruvyl transferase WcaK-like protein
MNVEQAIHLRAALFGQFGTGNFGNDASLLAAVAALRAYDRDVEILCLCYEPESVTRRYGLPATAIRSYSADRGSRPCTKLGRLGRRFSDVIRMYRLMRKIDVVVVPGSGLFEAGRHRPGSVASLLFTTALTARLAGTKFAVVSVGADVAERHSTRALLRWTLRLATYRSFRDDHSRRSAVGFGAPCEADPVYPDLVFGLENPARPSARNGPESVGVGVFAYHGPFSYDEPSKRDRMATAYVDSLTSFVEWLLSRGLNVTLFGGDLKDEKVAEIILDRIRMSTPEAFIDISRSSSFDDTLEHIRQVDYVVATRFHNIVAAVMTGTPAISLSYRAKNGELLNDLGLERFHQPLEDLDDERLREQFLDLQRSAEEVAHRMAAKYPIYRDQVALQWSEFVSAVSPKAKVGNLADARRRLQ